MPYQVVVLWQTGTVTLEPKVYLEATPAVGQVIKIETYTGALINVRTVKVGGGPAMRVPAGIDIVQAAEMPS